ncbi:hypothetical protein NIES4072_73320 [Nostoc commune NIES-4072]|uniref:DUF3865 domain-containing protein n=1 Tax=Nostoc commune NIES-4072 TaxID=2005467 RepID=A0A2R5FY22_NOSCO|nr:DUF3865 domain-containing protein [Nostoc commune]BBD70919.1 hypothetical protein NIES4070_73300 [Nostoc commune HK-02]GBG23620.1 hypothetical protein NIES4072_73320 [Nostoc commune NIES-4072]
MFVSKIEKFFNENSDSWEVFKGIMCGNPQNLNGEELVRYMDRMIEYTFDIIETEVSPSSLSAPALLHYINELGVFARHNSQFLKFAAAHSMDAVPEMAAEFIRNFLEEGGNVEIPAHYELYSSALLKDLDINIIGHYPIACTSELVQIVDLLSRSHSPSIICGAFYATEGVAIRETKLLRDITNAYAAIRGKTEANLPNLKFYYDLHLDHGVEQGHISGIARFICKYERYGLKLPQICDGFLQGMQAMTMWWTSLQSVENKIDKLQASEFKIPITTNQG